MTVAAKTPSVSYVEDGTTLNFAVPWRYLASSSLVVVRITGGVVSTLALGTHYSATPGGTDAGGTLTLVSTVAGSILLITRRTPRAQADAYSTNDSFPAKTLEGDLDRAMLVDQEQDVAIADIAARALRVPVGVAVAEMALPAPGKILVWNPAGDGIAYLDPAELITIVQYGTTRERTIVPQDYGAVGDGIADDTIPVQHAINAAVALYPLAVLDLTGTFAVSTLTISGGNGLNIRGSAVINAISSAAQNCLLSLMMNGVIIEGFIKLNVNYRQNYETGLWVNDDPAPGTPQFSILSSICVNGAKIGVRLGNLNYPSGLTSEVSLFGFSTYGCPIAIEAVGTETYISLIGCQLSADDFGGGTAWQALPKRAIRSIGAEVQVAGGEMLMTNSGAGYLVEVQPLAGAHDEGTIYGGVRCDGVFCETASPLVITANPSSLTISTDKGRRGLVSFTNCRGFHSQNSQPFAKLDSAFIGNLICRDNRFWYPFGTRSELNVSCDSSVAHIHMDDGGWGDGFLPTISGCQGGIIHFGTRDMLVVQDPQSQALAVGANTIKFAVLNGQDTARWEAHYSAATGIWTSEQAFANLRVRSQVAFAAAASGQIQILDNGGAVRTLTFTAQTEVAVDWETGNYASGRTIAIVVTITGSSATIDSSGYKSTLTISGRN